MSAPLFETVASLASRSAQRPSGHIFQTCHLHYNGPGSAGFGVKRTAMLLPESAMLLISPMGCGRSGTVVAEKHDFSDRMFYLCLEDRDVVTGAYLAHIQDAIAYIAAEGRFKALILCMTCIDALTGTDLISIAKKAERQYHLKVAATFMDPIVRDGANGPMVQIRQTITSCFAGGPKDAHAVNLLGVFTPLSQKSELHALLRGVGLERINSVADCAGFEELQAMGRASYNLVLSHQAEESAKDLARRFQTPYLQSFISYTPTQIESGYKRMENFFGATLPYAAYAQSARDALSDFCARRHGLRIAIGEALCGNPFDLACLLLSAGIEVPFILRNMLLPGDAAALSRLCALAPDIPVYSGVHPTTFAGRTSLPQADAALGLDAGYFLPQAISIAWDHEQTHFGFEAMEALLAQIGKGLDFPQSHAAQLHGSYLTI